MHTGLPCVKEIQEKVYWWKTIKLLTHKFLWFYFSLCIMVDVQNKVCLLLKTLMLCVVQMYMDCMRLGKHIFLILLKLWYKTSILTYFILLIMKAPVGSLTHLLTAQDDFDPRFDYSFEVKKTDWIKNKNKIKLKRKKIANPVCSCRVACT